MSPRSSDRGRPILVTGAHRSGTTWVGKMLKLAPGVGYLHEPFNPLTPPGMSSAPFDRFFVSVTPANEARYEAGLARTLRFGYAVGPQVRALRSPREAVSAAHDAASFARNRIRRARPLMKDPIALFSAEWLAERFGMDVVVTVRHPAGFVSSVTRIGWRQDFTDLVGDERLVAFDEDIRAQAENPGDLFTQTILLWRICYALVDGYRQRHPEWHFVRHEDVSRDPVPEYERLYRGLGLEFTERARREIESATAATNPAEADWRHGVRLDSRANVKGWRSRLSAEEIEQIREQSRDVWPLFYGDEDW